MTEVEGRVRLSAAGIDQTEALWTIAREQQERVFGPFDDEQVAHFKQVLQAIISA
ncbi:hypothetical protein [Pseudomonas asplenii]|uniref:hypothetical protein n=1 Tax=Pseudomonas asplenii TaxID=53407 RepID=UPI0018D48EB3